jgi:hypothetical protein
LDISKTLAGHELCTKDSWFFPIGVGPVPAYWAHPILPGQQAIARRVAHALGWAVADLSEQTPVTRRK